MNSFIYGAIHDDQLQINLPQQRLHSIFRFEDLLQKSIMSKIITVFGATGQQGGSVIRTILQDEYLSKEFKIRGITRDTSKSAAQSLLKQGVELVSVRAPTTHQKPSSTEYVPTTPSRPT
jgi:hypothetical protein